MWICTPSKLRWLCQRATSHRATCFPSNLRSPCNEVWPRARSMNGTSRQRSLPRCRPLICIPMKGSLSCGVLDRFSGSVLMVISGSADPTWWPWEWEKCSDKLTLWALVRRWEKWDNWEHDGEIWYYSSLTSWIVCRWVVLLCFNVFVQQVKEYIQFLNTFLQKHTYFVVAKVKQIISKSWIQLGGQAEVVGSNMSYAPVSHAYSPWWFMVIDDYPDGSTHLKRAFWSLVLLNIGTLCTNKMAMGFGELCPQQSVPRCYSSVAKRFRFVGLSSWKALKHVITSSESRFSYVLFWSFWTLG